MKTLLAIGGVLYLAGSACAGTTIVTLNAADSGTSYVRVPPGETVLLQVPSGASFAPQWTCNTLPIPGATGTTYTIASAGGTDGGTYTAGPLHTGAITLDVLPAGNLTNFSALQSVPAGGQSPGIGFIEEGNLHHDLLIRAVGPSLTGYGVAGADQRVWAYLYDSDGALDPTPPEITDFSPASALPYFLAYGAFPLSSAYDSAWLESVGAGAHTVSATDLSGLGGISLVELYQSSSADVLIPAPDPIGEVTLTPPFGQSASDISRVRLAPGYSLTLLSPTGSPVQWTKNGQALAGGPSTTYVLPYLTGSDSGTYAVAGLETYNPAFSAINLDVVPEGGIVNCSAWVQVPQNGALSQPVGIVVGGNNATPFLLRAVGASLGAFGVSNTVAQPGIRMCYQDGSPVTWSTFLGSQPPPSWTDIFAAYGAFPLTGGEQANINGLLRPGAYTVRLFDPSGHGGLALLEFYQGDSPGPLAVDTAVIIEDGAPRATARSSR